jgi:hypothetical protein
MIVLVILVDIVLSAFRTQGSEVSKKLQLLDMQIFLESSLVSTSSRPSTLLAQTELFYVDLML